MKFIVLVGKETNGIQKLAAKPQQFHTDFGAINILICYDIEFPEPARQVYEANADLDALTQSRINGTTIPFYDRQREV